MDDKIESLMENQTCDLVELPKSKRAMHNIHWLKEKNDGTRRYKARLVVKEFQ